MNGINIDHFQHVLLFQVSEVQIEDNVPAFHLWSFQAHVGVDRRYHGF